jgi:hypothetical protein
MVPLFEEIVVEFVAIAAPLVALACLIYLIAATYLERRELHLLAAARVRECAARRGNAQQRPRRDKPQGSPAPTIQAQH